MIKSISYDQTEILKNILKLYIKEAAFHLDPTFSRGNFYKKITEPILKSDLFPQQPNTIQNDCRNLPFANNSINSIIFDPPFTIGVPNKSKGKKGSNIIRDRFGSFKSKDDLLTFYSASLKEFMRVLVPNGYLVFKCQDTVSSGKQHLIHCDIYNLAMEIGYKVIDLFVLLAKSRIMSIPSKWSTQLHARKYHCYFFVFRKNKS